MNRLPISCTHHPSIHAVACPTGRRQVRPRCQLAAGVRRRSTTLPCTAMDSPASQWSHPANCKYRWQGEHGRRLATDGVHNQRSLVSIHVALLNCFIWSGDCTCMSACMHACRRSSVYSQSSEAGIAAARRLQSTPLLIFLQRSHP